MPPFDTERYARSSGYALSGQAAVATLAQLRQETFPGLIEAPRFLPRARAIAAQPDWLGQLWEYLSRRALLVAGLAALMLLLATTLSSWALPSSSTAPSSPLLSSAGVTGTAATRVEDLSVATFAGRIPFVQQARYLDALTGGPEAQWFVQGAREASLARYLQVVGGQVTLPYVSDAVDTKAAIEAWTSAVAEVKRQEAIQAAAGRSVWQAPPLSTGAAVPSTVTFYSCIGNGFCNVMASGLAPFEGAAACSTDMPFGTRFVIASDPSRRVFVCLDRGALASTWVDIWFYDAADGWAWQSIVGTSSDIIIVE